MGSFHLLKIMHFASIAIWSSLIFYGLGFDQIKLRHYLLYGLSFLVTMVSGVILLVSVGLNLTGEYPSWVYLKYVLTFFLFVAGGLSLKKKWLSAPWYYFIILTLIILTIFVSVKKPYL